jgi:hypothetical protein
LQGALKDGCGNYRKHKFWRRGRNGVDGTEAKLDELCAAALKRRDRRGRPKRYRSQTPRRMPPEDFSQFLAARARTALLIGITDAELRQQTEAEIVEEALVRMARSLSNRNPRLAKRLERAGR